MKQDIYRHRNERYAVYAGERTQQFAPDLAGISYVDATYEIQRMHGGFYVFEYVISGQGYVQQNEMRYPVQAGDAYILQPATFQHYGSDRQNPWTKVWFNVNGSLVRHLLSDYSLDATVVIPGFGDGSKLLEIVKIMEGNPVSCRDQIAVLLLQHIQLLSAFLNAKTEQNAAANSMKKYIEENLSQPLSIDALAAHVHLSRSRALHLYKECFQTTPYHDYFSLKLELSLTLLSRTTLTVSEIAMQLGFNDCQHYSSAFKKKYGLSPMKYRRSIQTQR